MNHALFSKLLAVSGGIAFTMIGVALYRQQRNKNESHKNWELEKAGLQKDKELLEQKLFELENILERMSKEIETLKTSLKDKQRIVSSQETEKERLQEQDRKTRKETDATIEQLQKRAQNFLRELEAKSLLCGEQAQHLLNLEASNKQLVQEKKTLVQEIQQKDQLLVQSNEHLLLLESNRDLVVRDIKHLLTNYVFSSTNSTSSHGEEYSNKVSPMVEGISSVRDPTLVSICKKYALQQYMLHEQIHHASLENGKQASSPSTDNHSEHSTNSSIVSFTVSVDGVNASKVVS